MTSLNWTMSQTLNIYSDLKRNDRAYQEVTDILSLIDDPEMKLLRTFLSTPSKPSMQKQNTHSEEKLDLLVRSLEKKMKAAAAFTRSVAQLASASATADEILFEEKNLRSFLEKYGQRQKVRDKLFQKFSEDVKNLSLVAAELREEEVEKIEIPDLDCNISELYRNLVDWKPKYDEYQLSKCAQWVLWKLEGCLSLVEAGRSQITGDSRVRVDVVDNREGEGNAAPKDSDSEEIRTQKEQELENTKQESGHLEADLLSVNADKKARELLMLAEVGVLRDKLDSMLEVQIKGREQLMKDKQELAERLENVTNMLNAAEKSKDLAIGEIQNHIERRGKLRQELANTKQEKDSLEAELLSLKQQLESFTENENNVITSLSEKLEAKDRELKQKDEEICLLKQLEASKEILEKCLEDADSVAAVLESQKKELANNNVELNMKVEKLETEMKELKTRLESGEKGNFCEFKGIEKVDREAETVIPQCEASDPVAWSTPKKCKDENKRGKYYSIEDIQKVVGEFVVVESAGRKLLDFFEMISEESGVVSRRMVHVILEESPHPFWVTTAVL